MSEFQFIKNTMYELKRKYPAQVIIQVHGDSALDLFTGEILQPTVQYTIDWAVLLPKTNKFVSLSGMSIGSTLSVSTRQLLIDAEDLPASVHLRKEGTKVLYNDEVWDVSSIDLIEGMAYDIRLKEIEGSLT